ncbi:hypothetical protein ABW19_dt0201081 [Dactylella cylindrospora]|nr:hypothetical protein ABW19_dt0201081 [Dactylella cylindrospora]
MTLCLAASFITTRTFSPTSQLRNYILWYTRGYLSSIDSCFDIGNLTRQTLGFWTPNIPKSSTAYPSSSSSSALPDAILTDELPTEKLETLQKELNKSYNRKSFSGNGSLMRTVPVALFYHSSPPSEIITYSHLASQLTHPYLTNGEACAVYNILVASILSHSNSNNGETIDKESLFKILKEFEFTDETLKGRFEVYKTLKDLEERDEGLISSSGYVVNSLEAVLWAFFSTGTWEEGALKVVNLGDDADTVGAIYGGLAGAYYGTEGIPARWVDRLVKKDLVEKIAKDLYQVIAERDEGLKEA